MASAGGSTGADYTPEEAAKCVKFVRAILREYGASPVFFQDVQDLITDMDSAGQHYALRFAEKMKEIDEVEWGIVDEEPPAPGAPAHQPRGSQGAPQPTLVYVVIVPRTTPPTVRLVASHKTLREAFSYVSERLGRGAIPTFVSGSANHLRYMSMIKQVRVKGDVFIKNQDQDLEFMVIPDNSKHLYVDGVHYVKV
jgi:hypothetical protein